MSWETWLRKYNKLAPWVIFIMFTGNTVAYFATYGTESFTFQHFFHYNLSFMGVAFGFLTCLFGVNLTTRQARQGKGWYWK